MQTFWKMIQVATRMATLKIQTLQDIPVTIFWYECVPIV